jgi:Tol biopolymer transport system component
MIANDNRDIWVMDLARGVPLRITFDAGNDWTASWSPDGTRIAFGSTRATKTQIYEKSATGSGAETVLSPDESSAIPVNWSPDNKYIVFSRPKQLGQNARIYDTWLMPVSGEHKGIPYLETSFDKSHARVSPDGRWIAYATNESGMYQIVVQTFPDSNGGKWPISAQGGTEPKWRRDGGELYYLAFDGKLMAVPVSGPAFVAGQPVALFQTPLKVNRSQPPRDRRYDVSPDGRFLVVVPETASSPSSMTVVVNWPAALGK